ncbi:MAG: signal peptidase I [Crocinitomicaceae bacterium]|nr:signal peptidase I [Crocinitomicaceae bacterium]
MFVLDIPHILLYLLIGIYFAALPKIFKKAGYKNPVHGYIPVYNLLILFKLMEKPWWWILLMCVPGVNFLMLLILNVNVSFCTGKRTFKDAIIALLVPHYSVIIASYDDKQKWTGPLVWKNKKEKGLIREWGDALLFAIVAAGIIRGFFFEAFTIPTGSMEKDLLIGDYLFVNKIAYGPKLPQTPLAVPFFHNNIPGSYTQSYLNWFGMDYHRVPGYTDVERNDIVVFNYPAGDTALLGKNKRGDELQGHNYHQFLRDEAFYLCNCPAEEFEQNREEFYAQARKNLLDNNTMTHTFTYSQFGERIKDPTKFEGWIERPTDKKENYIKRCVGIAGDTMEIVNGKLIVNGADAYLDENAQFNYNVISSRNFDGRIKDKFKEEYDINPSDVGFNSGVYRVPMSMKAFAEFSKLTYIDTTWVNWKPRGYYNNPEVMKFNYMQIFPNNLITKDWTEDNMGPWYLPKRGDQIAMNEFNAIFYRRAIESYEKNHFEITPNGVYINGELSETYTFKMNYYWLMGDNRHNSLDSRMWGYVPEDHVVGKAAFIWYSKDNEKGHEGVRWGRIFQSAH